MNQTRNPWLWVPSLYFSQGIPYVIVMTMSVIMYKRLGISNTDIALYTSWLYLPWVIKPLWSPLVDITRTKRFWVVLMQFTVAASLAFVAFTIPGTQFFRCSLFLFWIMAFSSATHDIAADGFYMLSLTKHEQAWWVGLRSTFYRTAMIIGSGLLVVLAGVLEGRNGPPALSVKVQSAQVTGAWDMNPPPSGEISFVTTNEIGFYAITNPSQITITTQPGPLRIIAHPSPLFISSAYMGETVGTKIRGAHAWNVAHGFVAPDHPVLPKEKSPGSWWSRWVATPLHDFLSANFHKADKFNSSDSALIGNVGLIYLALSQPLPPGNEIAFNFGRNPHGLEYIGFSKNDKGFRVVEGDHLAFNSTNWNQPAMVAVQIDPVAINNEIIQTQGHINFRHPMVGLIETDFSLTSGNIPLAWSITLFTVAFLFLAFSCWHSVMLPRPPNDGPVVSGRSLFGDFFITFGSFFQKPGIGLALAFILLYRFDEAQLSKVISPFLLDARSAGGLGFSTSQVGLAYGTFGILALTCGGLLGGFLAARFGLKKMLPYMIGSMYLPKLAFVFLSFTQPENFLAICGTVAVEQFGYGFGFTAFMLYLLYFADGPHKTAHYAICTGLMALGMMIPGMWSGWLVDIIGYKHFFVWVICSALPGFTLALLLKIDPQFGRR